MLEEFFKRVPRAALAFSGGVDSAYLLYAGVSCGARIQPYFVKTPFQPEFELEDARRLAGELKVPLKVIEYDILQHSQVRDNPGQRCYFCKRALFEQIIEQAQRDGFEVLLDGTNASDQVADRPGMRALQELKVCSPLRECDLTKEEIRRRSREAGLFTWDKPAYACLATRIPEGQPITREALAQIEAGENALSRLGFSDFRIRLFHGAARIQLPREQWLSAADRRQELTEALKPYFKELLLDMEVR